MQISDYALSLRRKCPNGKDCWAAGNVESDLIGTEIKLYIARSKRERFGIRFTTMSVIFLLLKPSASVIFGSPIEIK